MSTSPSSFSSAAPMGSGRGRSAWLRWLMRVHWISAAVCLAGILLFAVTGLTLNHAGAIEARPVVVRQLVTLPPPLLAEVAPEAALPDGRALPVAVQGWLQTAWALPALRQAAEWSDDEIYLPLPRPGGDAWLRIDRLSGEVEYERTDRGWIAWANDLHKGRHTGEAWSGLIDVLAGGCLLFSLSGLLILQRQAAQRWAVWPLLSGGLVLPALLILLFIH